ncbi:MAG: LytR C-terminal domain-containing protein [Ignavibacteria bacterium]|nr:LytR C-terminal domain-containing protein [Ignavibacteria bacterium]
MDKKNKSKVILNYALNTLIIILVFIIAYFLFSMFSSKEKDSQEKITIKTSKDTSVTTSQDTTVAKFITVEVLNGAGESKLAYRVSEFLKRQTGVDVLKYDNFRTDDIQQTIVQSRDGDIQKAHKIAKIIGVEESRVNIVKGNELEAEVRIIVGKDFRRLKMDL